MAGDAYADALAIYEAIAAEAGHDGVKGKANRYTSLNGNMFSFLDRDATLCLRMDKAAREAWNTAHGTGPVIQYGSVMKDYVAAPPGLPRATLAEGFAAALAHARTLKPKPTTKKR